jgi:hypothetical protein
VWGTLVEEDGVEGLVVAAFYGKFFEGVIFFLCGVAGEEDGVLVRVGYISFSTIRGFQLFNNFR